MKSMKKGFISIAVVASLTTTSFLQAEGWFSNLLGSEGTTKSESEGSKGGNFPQMLKYVPADTTYL